MEQFLYTSDQLLIKSCLQPEICKNCPLGQGFIQIEKNQCVFRIAKFCLFEPSGAVHKLRRQKRQTVKTRYLRQRQTDHL